MKEIKSGESVRSPFLQADVASFDSLQDVANLIEDDIEGFYRGVDNFSVVDPVMNDLYSFQAATDPNSGNKWFNEVAVVPERNFEYITDHAQNVVDEISGGEYSINVIDDFSHSQEARDKLAEEADIQLRVSDNEERDETVRMLEDSSKKTVGLGEISSELEAAEFDSDVNDSGGRFTHEVELEKGRAFVQPDLLTGWFDVESGFSSAYSSKVWMPYADQDSAILVRGEPSEDGVNVESHVVTYDSSRTGDFFSDAVTEAAEHYLPFSGVLTPQVPGEAVEFYLDDSEIHPNIEQPRNIEVRQKALNQLGSHEFDSERVRDIIYRKAAEDNPRGLYTNGGGHRDQIGNEENYIRWTEDNGKIVLHELYDDRQEAIPVDDRT